MSDLFHEDVPDEYITHVFANMVATEHTFQILTKRPKRMLEIVTEFQRRTSLFMRSFANIWFGVTIELPEYSYRAHYLRQTPAAVRYISFEPLLSSFADYPGTLDEMDWCIVGGESGPGARPMHPDWARDLRDQCQTAGIKFHFKQWGAWKPIGDFDLQSGTYHYSWQHAEPYKRVVSVGPDGKVYNNDYPPRGGWHMTRVGKKTAGRILDGKEWNEFPNR